MQVISQAHHSGRHGKMNRPGFRVLSSEDQYRLWQSMVSALAKANRGLRRTRKYTRILTRHPLCKVCMHFECNSANSSADKTDQVRRQVAINHGAFSPLLTGFSTGGQHQHHRHYFVLTNWKMVLPVMDGCHTLELVSTTGPAG